MALQAQTSSDPDNLLFTAADCDDLNLSAAIGKFVFEPLAPELREAVGDGWVWLLTVLTKINSIAEPTERAEARQAFNRMKRQFLPDYTEAEYMAVYAQKDRVVVDGRRFFDKPRDGDVLDILAFQKHASDLPSNKADFIWPTQLEVEDILPALHFLAELSERPADKNAIRSVARRITTRWHDLIEFLRRGELVAMGIRNHRERVSPEFWSDQKTRIDVLSARVITEAIVWTDVRLFVTASRAVGPAVPLDDEVRRSPAHLRRSRSKMIAVASPASMAPTGPEAEQPARQNHSELKGQMAHAAQAVNALDSKLFKNMRVKVRDNLINDWLQKNGLPRIPPRTMRNFFQKWPL